MQESEPERRPPPTEAQVRAAFMAFASMIRRLDAQELLLPRLPLLMGKLGDLRHMAFEYEVRMTERLGQAPKEDGRSIDADAPGETDAES